MMKVLEETFSLCPDCLRVVPAKYVEINGKVYMQKNCCKKELILVENDVKFFKEFILPFKIERSYISEGMTFQEINRHNLKWNKDVQLYITSKCNLKCPICYQRFCAYQPDLSLDEIKFKINGGRINMARRDKMKAALSGMYAQSLKPHTDEKIADQICGKCKNFSENAWASDGRAQGYWMHKSTGTNLGEITGIRNHRNQNTNGRQDNHGNLNRKYLSCMVDACLKGFAHWDRTPHR